MSLYDILQRFIRMSRGGVYRLFDTGPKLLLKPHYFYLLDAQHSPDLKCSLDKAGQRSAPWQQQRPLRHVSVPQAPLPLSGSSQMCAQPPITQHFRPWD
jgi:hypothetical protein